MAQTVSEAMVDGVLGDLETMPQEPLPAWADMLGSVPTMSAVAGTKAYRGTGTILKGGSGVGQHFGGSQFTSRENRGKRINWRYGGAGATREGLSQANYLNPRNWGRFGSQDYFHHTGPIGGPNATGAAARSSAGRNPATTTNYTPFYAAAAPNWLGRQFAEGGRFAEGKLAQSLRAKELLGPGGELVSPGFYSRVSAAGRLGWMSDKKAARPKTATSVARFLQGAGYSGQAVQEAMGSRMSAGGALAMSGGGSISGRIGGFYAGAGTGVGGQVLRESGRGAHIGFAKSSRMMQGVGLTPGAQYTARQMAQAGFQTAKQAGTWGARAAAVGKGTALAGARIGGLAIPGVNILMTAWLVHDLAKLGVKGVGHGIKTAGEAVQSLEGDLRTGIMDKGFTDTQATMTSRARGVQAIQNSRLNARSILGNEAGAMASHFN